MTAIGPLTTTFQAPSSCTTNTPQIYQIHTGKEYNYVQGPLFTPGSDCYPSGYDASPSAYYSPGICPHGYTAACTNLGPAETAPPPGTVTKSDGAVETAIVCCPTALSYTCVGSGIKASLACTTAFSRVKGVIGATVVKDGTIGSYGVFTETEGGFAAYGIQVRFQSTDSPVGLLNVPQQTSSSPVTRSTGAVDSTTVATFPVPIQTQPPGGQIETKTEGVSTGAAIGIAIGSAIAGILAVSIIGLFFFLRWRRKRRAPPVPPKETSLYNNNRNIPNIPRPPYELSEEPSPRTQSRRLRLLSIRRTRPSTRRGALPQANPAELEAVVPSDSSYLSFSDNRSTPESSNSGWTSRMQRDGVMPTPWI